MSDINKGYTFTDKSTDWASNKETAIRLNKMLDDAKINLVAGTNITITPTANGPSISASGGGTGTVTSVNLTAGTNISVSGGPITTSGSITVNNTAPDQVVSLTGAGTTTVTGTYPSFTITSNDAFTGTVTSVAATAGTGITISGSPITSSGTLNITNSAPDQTVTLSGGTGITVSGTYPSFTVTNSSPSSGGTVTSVSVVTANGVSGTVADPTTTPAITLTLGDISAATSKPTGTSSVTRTFAVRAGDVFNVKDYGATGDGSTNDLPAFNAAATAMLAYGGGCIYMPAPAVSYKLAGVWTITQTTNSQSICLRGDGPGVTKLFFSSASNGVEIIASVAQTEGATTSNVVTVEDFSICASQVGTYKALKIVGININGSSIGCAVRRISIEGYNVTKYWISGIHLVDLPNVVIENIRMVSASNTAGDGILLEGNGPTVDRSPTVCDIWAVNVQGFLYGIRVIGTNTYEGVTVSQSTFVLCGTGIYWNTTTGEEQLNITDCHCKSLNSWVNAVNCERVWITNGNFHKDGEAAFTGIDINTNCTWATITNSYLRCGSSDVAISMDSDNHTITGNKIEGPSIGIVLNSGSDRSLVALNQLYNSGGTARAGTCVQDNGSGNQVFNNY
jgi:hypothetical protein